MADQTPGPEDLPVSEEELEEITGGLGSYSEEMLGEAGLGEAGLGEAL